MPRGLILDKRSSVLALQVGRALARRGYRVDLFGQRGSPAFRSRFCDRHWTPDAWRPNTIAATLRHLVQTYQFDAIYLCSEELLAIVLELLASGEWNALPISTSESLKILLSKNLTLRVVQDAKLATPITAIPDNESDVSSIGRELGFPLVVKGEHSEGGDNVRTVTREDRLLKTYRKVQQREAAYSGRPALQEYLKGPAYSVGGLFDQGRPLRVCAHRKLLTFPPGGGWTVKGVTEHPPGLLEEAFKVFAALRYTGLGHVEFIRDLRDGQYKFIELNPRVWGSIGIVEHAGVDLYKPYQTLADGLPVKADLRFQENIVYHRFSGELRFMAKRPLRLVGFVKDALSHDVQSDFEWSDPSPHIWALCGTGDRWCQMARARNNATELDDLPDQHPV